MPSPMHIFTVLCGLASALAVPVTSSGTSASASVPSISSTSSATSSKPTAVWAVPSGWTTASSPCIAEGNSGRALTYSSFSSSDMTIEKCLAYCDNANMPLAGLEFSTECYCGNVLANGASLSSSGVCNMDCSADSGRKCGGSGTLSLYISTKSNAASLSADLTSTSVTLPTGWTSTGCFKEGTAGRALDGWSYNGIINTAVCINYCKTKGFSMAGLEYGGECYCDNAFRNGAGDVSSSCNMPCNGAPGENCGGRFYLNKCACLSAGSGALRVYSNPSLAPASTTSNGFAKTGCYQEVSGRALTGAAMSHDSMTVDMCTSFCKTSGYLYAAVEYGKECYCGDSLMNGFSWNKYSTQCSMTCPGNKKQNCGGPNALAIYSRS